MQNTLCNEVPVWFFGFYTAWVLAAFCRIIARFDTGCSRPGNIQVAGYEQSRRYKHQQTENHQLLLHRHTVVLRYNENKCWLVTLILTHVKNS